MNTMTPDLKFSIALPTAAHRQAEDCRATQINPQRAKQRYLDSLALYALDFYTACLGLEPDWAASDSRDPLHLQLAPVADLVIPSLGRLECCALLPGAQQVEVSPDAWGDRIAYVAVQLDPSLEQAGLLGFMPEVTSTQGIVTVSDLRPMEVFPKYLNSLRSPGTSSPWIQLEAWFKHRFEAGWQALEQSISSTPLAGGIPMGHALAFRGAVTGGAKKTISLRSDSGDLNLEMVLKLTPKTDRRLRIEPQLIATQGDLPLGLSLAVIDDQQQTFLSVTASGQETALQTQAFLGKPGEQFTLAVILGDHYIQEQFQV